MKNASTARGLSVAIAVIVTLSFLPMLINAQTKGTFTDPRDKQVYNWAKVGNQTWMTQNLKYNVAAASWAYNNDSVNLNNYGRLYTWKAAQVACPKGWHLPTDKDWSVIIESLGGGGEAGLKMQAMDTIGKGPAAPGANSGLLGGVRHPDGSCIGLNFWGGCWSAGKVNDSVANNILFAHATKDMGLSTNDKKAGFSVRCIKTK
ncbi:MAG: FISUMP domain-containing protein [bacterium]